LAGFELTLFGRFWVTPEVKDSTDAEVYVNPDRVTFVRQYTDELTTINFSEEHTVTVKMQAGAVASALFSAGKP